MTYSPITQLEPIEIVEKLKSLFNCQQVRVLKKQHGGNSRVWCVEADNKRWALKTYPPDSTKRHRLTIESKTYHFLNQHHVPGVPVLKSYSETEHWLLMEWIEGNLPEDYSDSDIEQAMQFIQTIAALNQTSEAGYLPLASEACLSLTILINQIEQRFQRLMLSADQHQGLQHFLHESFRPIFEYHQQRAVIGYRHNGMDVAAELPRYQRSLIPADFGFHNAIRDKEGKLFFIDFDYFGWDDPVKLLADILWHPKMIFTPHQKIKIIQKITEIYHMDNFFSRRFNYHFPLFGLRWVLILLNEFIPVYWLNRQYAGAHQDQMEAREVQLQRAKELLEKVQREPTYDNIHTTV